MYSQSEVKNEQEIKMDEHIQLAEIEENATKEHLDTIMRMNPNAMSTFRLNVTKNTCNHGSSRYRNLLMLQQKGTIDGYVEDALPLFPYEKERAEFHSLFCRDQLLHAFEQGEVQIELKHHYMVTEEKMCVLKTIVNLMKNKTYTLGRFDYEPGVVASSVDMDNRPLEDYSILLGKPVNVRELCGILSKQIAEYRK